MKKLLFFVVVVFVLSAALPKTANAMNTGYLARPMSLDEVDYEFNLITEPTAHHPIVCWAVSEEGLIAIGTERLIGRKTVSVYDTDMNFLYGYTFTATSAFRIAWDGPNVIVYFVRGNCGFALSSEGKIVEAVKIDPYSTEYTRYSMELDAATKQIGGNRYCARNDFIPFNVLSLAYSRLYRTDVTGETVLLYDAQTEFLLELLIYGATFIGFWAIIIIMVVKQIVKGATENAKKKVDGKRQPNP